MDPAPVDLPYRPRGRLAGVRAGAHPSTRIGSLGAFRDQVPFHLHPDARRIDIRATLRDPFETTIVRRAKLSVSVDIYALVDLSASLNFEGRCRKRDLARSLCMLLAQAATRAGDRFGLIGYDGDAQEACHIPASRRRGLAAEVDALLATVPNVGGDCTGLVRAAEQLAGKRKVVFLISDFLLPLAVLRQLFDALAHHDVIPVVLDDTAETIDLPSWGFLDLADLESGRTQTVFMRPNLRRAWLQAHAARRAELSRLAEAHGRRPVTLTDRLNTDDLIHQLMDA